MPVWVKGNIESGIFIIVTHGGPGSTTGHDFTISKGFQDLEMDYAFVYWDQRLSGLSQGDPSLSTLTIEQHVEDQGMIVDFIINKYNPESLFMMGHSWGGVLTGKYLGRGDNQDNFKGWIDMDGSIQDEFEGQAKKEWILDHVGEFYDQNPKFWQYITDWYKENPNPVEDDWQPYTYVSALGGYAYDWDKTQELNPTPYKELVFSSQFTLAFYFSQYSLVPWMNGFDATEEVSNIAIPALLLWGKEDGSVPTPTAQFTYDLLATDSFDKEIVILDECAHSPHMDVPYEFARAVGEFVESYK